MIDILNESHIARAERAVERAGRALELAATLIISSMGFCIIMFQGVNWVQYCTVQYGIFSVLSFWVQCSTVPNFWV